MVKVRQSYRAHSARGLWQAVSVLTERVSQADIPTMELVQATKALAEAAEALRILAGDPLPKCRAGGPTYELPVVAPVGSNLRVA